MLTKFTLKLCPLLSLAIATIGCGKKITESDTRPASTVQNTETPSAYTLRLESLQGRSKRYKTSKSANFLAPEVAHVLSGSSAGKMVTVIHDVNEFDSDLFYFKCNYVPTSDPKKMALEKCYNDMNIPHDDISSYEWFIYKNSIIEINYSGSYTSDFVVEINYDMY